MDKVDIEAGLPKPEMPDMMQDHEPASILEQQLRQARQSQSLVQLILDSPRNLLCVACCELAAAVEQVAVGYALDQQVKLGKVLSGIVPVWQKLHDAVVKGVENLSREEMLDVFLAWFMRLPSNIQRDVLQGMTQTYNETNKLRGGNHG